MHIVECSVLDIFASGGSDIPVVLTSDIVLTLSEVN